MELHARVLNTHRNPYKQKFQGVQISEICSPPILTCEKEECNTQIYRDVNNSIACEGKLNDEEVYLTQMSAAKGIRAFGDRAIQTVLNEFSQLDHMGIVEPLNPGKMP